MHLFAMVEEKDISIIQVVGVNKQLLMLMVLYRYLEDCLTFVKQSFLCIMLFEKSQTKVIGKGYGTKIYSYLLVKYWNHSSSVPIKWEKNR